MVDKQIDVHTSRLHLRTLRESDAVRLHALLANWEVIRWLSTPAWPYALQDACSFITARKVPNPDVITAAITLDGALIGVINALAKLESTTQRERGHSIGYWIGQPYWGRGYMTEAARGFIAHVFATISRDRIFSGAFIGNVASLRVQEKLGFIHDGKGMLSSKPNGKDVLHLNTILTRARFATCH